MAGIKLHQGSGLRLVPGRPLMGQANPVRSAAQQPAGSSKHTTSTHKAHHIQFVGLHLLSLYRHHTKIHHSSSVHCKVYIATLYCRLTLPELNTTVPIHQYVNQATRTSNTSLLPSFKACCLPPPKQSPLVSNVTDQRQHTSSKQPCCKF